MAIRLPTGAPQLAGYSIPDVPLKPSSPTDTGVTVMDPLGRKLRLPIEIVTPTRAALGTGSPSLCVLHLENRCRQGKDCHQVHADPAAVEALRARALAQPSCCGEHGDPDAAQMIRVEDVCTSLVIDGIAVSTKQLAYTFGLERIVKAAPPMPTRRVEIQSQLLCRLHAVDKCYFCDDCKFVHVCREVVKQRFPAVVAEGHQMVASRKHGTSGGKNPQPRQATVPAAPAMASPTTAASPSMMLHPGAPMFGGIPMMPTALPPPMVPGAPAGATVQYMNVNGQIIPVLVAPQSMPGGFPPGLFGPPMAHFSAFPGAQGQNIFTMPRLP